MLQDVFGVATPVYRPNKDERQSFIGGFSGIEFQDRSPDYDNAPIRYDQKSFGAFWLKGGTYKTWDYTGKLVDVQLGDLLMPLATLVDFKRDKNISKTPMLGGGSVKEIYNLMDWDISINGIILRDDHNPPGQQSISEQREQMERFNEVAGSIEVSGQIFAEKNISRLTIESLSIVPAQGKPNMLQYSMTATSDEDIILTEGLR